MRTPDNQRSAVIQAKDLSKTYAGSDTEGDRGHVVLERLEFEVSQGEFVALLGKSGSGKTTLLNLLSGIDTPTTGSLVIAGREISELTETERTLFRRRHVGFVFQFFNLISTLSVLENVALPLTLNPGSSPSEPEAAALGLLERVGLGDRGASFPEQLSGGEQQRVAIARALVHEPEIVLADEPTGNLDRETGEEILSLLEELVRAQRRTLIVATHSREVLGRADRVFTIDQARLIEASGRAAGQTPAGDLVQRSS